MQPGAGAAVAILLCWGSLAAACSDRGSSPSEAAGVSAIAESAADAHGGPVAVLVVDNSTGEITAAATAGNAAGAPLGGGSRPAASLAKVVVLAAVLESGVAPYDVLSVPQCIRVQARMACTARPGEMSVAEATARSNDPAFIILAERSGFDAVVARGALVGMDLEPSRLLPLGLDVVRMESVAALFAALANDGETVAITDGRGVEVVGASGRLVSAETARAMRKVLRTVVTDGTGVAADGAGEPYGKTGTAEGRTGAWFAGVSGDRTIVVWAGAAETAATAGSASTTEPPSGILADYEELLGGSAVDADGRARLTGGGLPAQVFREVADLLATPVHAP